MDPSPSQTSDEQNRLLRAIGLVAVLGAHIEDSARTLCHMLAEDPEVSRTAGPKHAATKDALKEARRLARQRTDSALSRRVTGWTHRAKTALESRNEVIHSVWPYGLLETVPFRLRTGSDPRDDASIVPVPVDIGEIELLGQQLEEVATEGTKLTWDVLEIYPDFLESASWKPMKEP